MSDVVSNPNQNPTSAAALAAAAEGTQIVIQADRDGTDDPTITGSSTVFRDGVTPETGSFTGLRPGYSGDGYVDFGSNPGDTLTFTVNMATAGRYDLSVRYASNGFRPISGLMAPSLSSKTSQRRTQTETPSRKASIIGCTRR